MATIQFNYSKDEFRVCPVTSFRVHKKAEPLMTINAVAAIIFLSIGGFAALLMGLHKMPALNILSDQMYYTIVTLHGINMLILWIVFFEIAAVYFVSTALLNSRLASVPLGWIAFALMLLGALMLEYTVLFEPASTVMFTAYMPLVADPKFYLGYIIFAVGVLLAGVNFFLTIYLAKKNGSYPYDSLPLTVYGVFIAVVIAVQAILNGAVVMVVALIYSIQNPTLQNLTTSIAYSGFFDADLWKQLFWGFGHTAQYINISATAAVWYALIAVTLGAKPLNEKYSRFAFLCYLIFTVPVATHHLIVDPAYSMPFKMVNATILALGLAVPSLIHAFVIPGAMEKKMREEGKAGDGLFSWIKALPWNEPGIGALFWSILLFGFGGILGSIQGTYQLNMITHNTLRINAHFHLTVVAGTTIAFMGLSYYFMELIPRKKIMFKKLASWQPHIYGIGLGILAIGMFVAGVLGAPRRTSTYEYYLNQGVAIPPWDAGLWLLGIGAIIAVIGGAIYVAIMVLSLFFGESLPKEGDWSSKIPEPQTEESNGNHTRLEAPGTLTLGLIFMFLFAVFYIVTFIVLAQRWPIGPRI